MGKIRGQYLVFKSDIKYRIDCKNDYFIEYKLKKNLVIYSELKL